MTYYGTSEPRLCREP